MDNESHKTIDDKPVFSIASLSWRCRFWLLFAIWVLSCLLFIVFNNEPTPGRLQATVSFGISSGLIIVILFIFVHEIDSYLSYIHAQLYQPFGFHLWRYRWVYLLVPTLVASMAGFTADLNDHTQPTIDWYESQALGFGLMTAFAIMWLFSILYAWLTSKLQWLVAVLLFPPLSIIFFFHGTEVENQSRVSKAVERSLDWIAARFWQFRWILVSLPLLLGGAPCSLRLVVQVGLDWSGIAHCIVLATIAATLVAMLIAFFKAWGNKKTLWVIGILVCPPLAFVYFFVG